MDNNKQFIKLAIGCGKRRYPGYIHIDKYPDNKNEVIKMEAHDTSFMAESINIIYACHVLEYYDWHEVEKKVLPHWFYILKYGGILRVAVPDFGAMAGLYYLYGTNLSKFIGPLYGKMNVGDTTIYHKSCFDIETLVKMLCNTGFTNVHRYNWRATDIADVDDHSQAYLPHMDKDNGTLISLNLECEKV